MNVQIAVAERAAPNARAAHPAEEMVGGALGAARLVDNLEVFVTALGRPDQLRRMVIELAIRGHLQTAATGDENVEILLRRVATDVGERNAKHGMVRPDEMPFVLPSHWKWVRWGHLTVETSSGWSPQCENRPRVQNEWGVLKVSAVSWGAFGPDENKALPAGVDPRAEFSVRDGDFLMSRANTAELVGRSVVVIKAPSRLLLSDKIVRCKFSGSIEQRFVDLYNRSSAARAHYVRYASGTSDSMKNISREVILSMPVPLPPIEEQKRIVARVDHLMALIDDLETKQTKKHEVSARFTKASLEALTTAEGASEFDTAWKRIVENFPTVIDRVEKVADVRQCIVGLALRGCLLPQKRSDGDARTILSRLSAEPTEVFDEPSISLPASWCWLPLGAILTEGPKNGFSPKAVDFETKVKSLTLTATTSGRFDGQFFKYIDHDIPVDSDLWLRDGDVLIQRGNTIEYVGVAAVYRGPEKIFIYPDLMMKVRISDEMDLDFVHMALNSPVARAFIVSRASGTSGSMPKINQAALKAIPIPVAPLIEQRRIVAKVTKLMKLCDDLEAKLHRAEDRASRLVEALVQEMAT